LESAVQARGRAHARAALVGNPSDGFGGRTIAVELAEFSAEATVRVAARQEVVNADPDGARLVTAAVKRFTEHCRESGHDFDGRVSVAYSTTIPRQVGLGGSSAIVIATMRALSAHCGSRPHPTSLARLALSAETDELGIPAGLQDRIVQAHGGLVYMDFERDEFEQLDPGLLPPLFVAYRLDASEPSAAVHTDIRRRFERGDRRVVEAMGQAAALAKRARDCLLGGRREELGELMAANVRARCRIVELDPRHARMIELAESLGAPANYAGSGGAIVGLIPRAGSDALRAAFSEEGCEVIEPASPRAPRAPSGSPSGA
jgi:glucuronokinase